MSNKIKKEDIYIAANKIKKSVGNFAREASCRLLGDVEEKGYSAAIEIGIEKTIAALYEADVDDQEILRIVIDQWELPRRYVEERLVNEKTQAVIRAVKQCLKLQGKTDGQFETFVRKNHLGAMIKNDTTLWKLRRNPQELIDMIKAQKEE